MERTILKSICLDYEGLDKDINSVLLRTVKKVLEKSCTKEDGYILEIKSIEKIIDNHISPSTSHIIFDLKLKCTIMKPEVGQVVTGVTKLVHQSGIFVSIHDNIVVLVPQSALQEYVFNNMSFSKDSEKVSIGSTVVIKITAVRYEENKFKCIGQLV